MKMKTATPYLPGLSIDSPLAIPEALNFKPPTWPPTNDWPISVDTSGRIISRFGDHTWDLSVWQGAPLSLSFNDGPKVTKRQGRIDPDNASLLRIIAAYWLYGENSVAKPRTLKSQITGVKPLFILCSSYGISASELYKHPRVVEEFVGSLRSKKGSERIFTEMFRLWYQRNAIGFVVLDDTALKKLAAVVTKRDSIQHAYIPPRIWTYQNLRLRECLDDFIKHQSKIVQCYNFCVNAYIQNAGSGKNAFTEFPGSWTPFKHGNRNRKIAGKIFYGRFRLTAEKYGIADLLDRWVDFSDNRGIQAFTSYLSLISFTGLVYILNFSLMRREEGNDLRANCFSIEKDSLGHDVYLVNAGTTKTQEDDDASWIVSKSAAHAIKSMKIVSNLRVSSAILNPMVTLSKEELENPLLQTRAYEPWSGLKHYRGREKKQIQSIRLMLEGYPKLLDPEMLRISSKDLAIAREINNSMSPDVFAIGKVWPLSWHQLRRTGAVNMLSSGLVTESDLCYQLKHLNRNMSRYYANNHRHLKASLNKQAAGTYLGEAYAVLARKAIQMLSEQYLSPHGRKRKAQIVETIESKTHDLLVKDSEAGRVSYHETFLGGCSKPGVPCPMGGISNISACMGYGDNKPCEWALVDRRKRPVIAQLLKVLKDRVKDQNEGSMLNQSLKAQIESVCRTLEVIDVS